MEEMSCWDRENKFVNEIKRKEVGSMPRKEKVQNKWERGTNKNRNKCNFVGTDGLG